MFQVQSITNNNFMLLFSLRSNILCKDTPIHDEFKIIEIILFSMGFIFLYRSDKLNFKIH